MVPDTVILEITATAPDPEQARLMAQAYAEGLSELVVDLEPPAGDRDALIKASIVDDAQVSDRAGLAAARAQPRSRRDPGLLLGLGLAVLRHRLDTRISSSQDVSEITPAPILGHIFHDAGLGEGQPRPRH